MVSLRYCELTSHTTIHMCKPCGLRRRSAAVQLLGSRIRILLLCGRSSLVFIMCCVGSGDCDELITRPEMSCRLCVLISLIVCDLEVTIIWRSRQHWALAPHKRGMCEKLFGNSCVPTSHETLILSLFLSSSSLFHDRPKAASKASSPNSVI
jgi:hypothetical protein